MATAGPVPAADAVDRERLLQTMLELIGIDSPTGQEEALGADLERRFAALGCEVERDAVGNLVARYPGGAGDVIMLSGHMDTFGPDTGITPEIRDGVVYSDGTTILGADDQSGIAIALETLQVLREHPEWPHPPLEIVLSVGEEEGLIGSRQMDLSRLRATWGLVIDTPGPIGSLTYKAPSARHFTFTVIGRSAHAGVEPEKGISAIEVAAEAIFHMPLGRIDAGTTANIGTIHGGTARNAVADRVVVEAETRALEHERLEVQTKAIVDAFERAAKCRGATVEVEIEDMYHAYEIRPDQRPYRAVVRAAERLGLEPRFEQSGGGTDGNVFNQGGIECVPISSGMAAIHTSKEHIAIQDLFDAARLVVTIVTQDGDGQE